MKRIFSNAKSLALIVCLLAMPIALVAQNNPLTNAVKIANLPSAATPLTGAEVVPIEQLNGGTNRTVQVSVNSFLYAATLAANAALTYGQDVSNVLSSVNGNGVTVSNNFSALSNNFAGFSNSTASTLNQRGSLYPSNALLVVNIADAGSAARSNGTSFYLVSNPAGYQSASQVTAAVNSGLAGAGLAVSNSAVNFSSVTTPIMVTPSLDLGGGFTIASGNTENIVINLATNSFQTVELNPGGGGSATYNFIFTNAADGQNVWLVASATNSGVAWKYQASAPTVGDALDSWNSSGNTSGTVSSSGKAALLNWQVFGGRVIFTSTSHP